MSIGGSQDHKIGPGGHADARGSLPPGGRLFRNTPWRKAVLLAALFVGTVVLRLASGPHAVDDAYITFRYAANFVAGQGLVYNAGERVLGTSAPLFAVILGVTSWTTGVDNFPLLALWINAIADGFSVLLLLLIAKRLGIPDWGAVTTGLILGVSPLVIRYSIGGMETSIVVLISLLAVYSHLIGTRALAFHLASLATWVRPDALALGAALLVSEGIATRGFPFRRLLILLTWVLLLTVALTVGYGIPIPHSVLAKAGQVYTVKPLTNFFQFVYMFAGLTPTGVQGFGARVFVIDPSTPLNRFAVGLLIPLGFTWVAGVRRLWAVSPRAVVIPVYVAFLVAGYSTLGLRGSLMAEWYLVPLTPFWGLPLVAGLVALQERFPGAASRVLTFTLAVLLVVLPISATNWLRDAHQPPTLPLNVWVEREGLYLLAAEFLRDKIEAGEVVAAPEIGALGYACGCSVLDTVGLISPAALSFYPAPEQDGSANYSVPVRLVEALKPDYLVTLDVFIRSSLLQDRGFQSIYREIWEAETTAFNSRRLVVYERFEPAAE
jgi:hypothetical protein